MPMFPGFTPLVRGSCNDLPASTLSALLIVSPLRMNPAQVIYTEFSPHPPSPFSAMKSQAILDSCMTVPSVEFPAELRASIAYPAHGVQICNAIYIYARFVNQICSDRIL